MTKLTLTHLSNIVFRACDDLFRNMDDSEYEEYPFGMLFFRRLLDQLDLEKKLLQSQPGASEILHTNVVLTRT